MVDQQYLKQSFTLTEDGSFRWKDRPASHFKSEKDRDNVNAQFSGKIAGRTSCYGYIQIGLNKRIYFAHRLVWLWHYGVWPNGPLDHINRNRRDNRIENLRQASDSSNQANVGLRSNNTSGYRGVSRARCRSKLKWRANICVRGIRADLGTFQTPEEASIAYEEAHRIAFREFSNPKDRPPHYVIQS